MRKGMIYVQLNKTVHFTEWMPMKHLKCTGKKSSGFVCSFFFVWFYLETFKRSREEDSNILTRHWLGWIGFLYYFGSEPTFRLTKHIRFNRSTLLQWGVYSDHLNNSWIEVTNSTFWLLHIYSLNKRFHFIELYEIFLIFNLPFWNIAIFFMPFTW